MELRQEYKKTEVGIIPEDWEVKEFGEVMDGFSSGQTPYRAVSDYYKGNIPWITSGELNYNVITDTIEKITIEGVKAANLKMIPKGTFLFAITGLEAAGTRGSCAITGIEATTNQSCMALYPKKNVLTTPYLFHYYVKYGNELAFKYCQGTKQQSYTGGTARKLPIVVPPTIEEQSFIANTLSDTDALISSLKKLIDKKRNLKQGVMQKLLQPKEGWGVKKLGDIGECIIGLTYTPANVKESGTLVLRSSNVQGGSLKFDDNVYVDSPISEKLIIRKNDILICVRNGSRNLIGKCALIKGEAVGETFGAFMSVYRSSFNEFVFILFQSDIIKRQIDEHLGATINQITNKSLNSFEIPFPPIEEQTRIATILSDMDAEIAALEAKLEKYRNIKLGMMQNLLTGKIRLV